MWTAPTESVFAGLVFPFSSPFCTPLTLPFPCRYTGLRSALEAALAQSTLSTSLATLLVATPVNGTDSTTTLASVGAVSTSVVRYSYRGRDPRTGPTPAPVLGSHSRKDLWWGIAGGAGALALLLLIAAGVVHHVRRKSGMVCDGDWA